MPGRIVLSKPSKYRSKPTIVEGVRFSSKKEAARWCELRLMEKAGAIENLKRQYRFPIVINGLKICDYYADFVYREPGIESSWSNAYNVVEDVKGGNATKTAVYKLKRAMMQAVYGINIRET